MSRQRGAAHAAGTYQTQPPGSEKKTSSGSVSPVERRGILLTHSPLWFICIGGNTDGHVGMCFPTYLVQLNCPIILTLTRATC